MKRLIQTFKMKLEDGLHHSLPLYYLYDELREQYIIRRIGYRYRTRTTRSLPGCNLLHISRSNGPRLCSLFTTSPEPNLSIMLTLEEGWTNQFSDFLEDELEDNELYIEWLG